MNIYQKLIEFKTNFPGTVAWRLHKHAQVIEEYINPDEEVRFAFCAQKNDTWYDVFSTCAVVLTNKRLLIAQKRVLWGSFYTQVTPDLYNDLKIYKGLFWGSIKIDTARELVTLTNLSKASLDVIETEISNFMMNEKRNYNYSNNE